MDINLFWLLALALAAPISGVIGFAIQLSHVKKARLENLKLQLQIEALRERAVKSERRLVEATPEEILKISSKDFPMLSRSFERTTDRYPVQVSSLWQSFKNHAILAGLIALLALFVFYLVYDLYRLGQWIRSIL